MWGKEGLCNIGQKRNKKKKQKKHIFICVPAMVAAGLARFKGQHMVERWGFEDPACGKRGLCNTGQKRNEKKKKKNIYLLMCL